MEARSGAVSRRPAGPAESPPNRLDLSAFPPAVDGSVRRWRHTLRYLDRDFRVLVPEACQLAGFDGARVAATLRPNGWELRAADRTDPGQVVLDHRRRLLVPPGIRQQLALNGAVVISLAVDRTRLVVWSSGVLDDVVEMST